jgi:hypothetical protein
MPQKGEVEAIAETAEWYLGNRPPLRTTIFTQRPESTEVYMSDTTTEKIIGAAIADIVLGPGL